MKIKEEIEEAERLAEIVKVLFEEGLDYLVYELEMHTHLPWKHRIKYNLGRRARKNFEESVLNALQKLGGIFVKGGQILSTRPDVVPPDFAKILEKLQDSDIPFGFNEAKKIIESELKKPIEEIFLTFSKKPVSAASLGQVHKAVLKDGNSVAVKIQRPKIDEKVRIDLKIIKWFLNSLKKKKPELKKYNLDEAFDELKRYTIKEMDYKFEAENIMKFEQFFKNDKNVIIPKVHKKFTTKKVLVMSWEEGNKLKPFYGAKEGKLLQKYGTSAMVRQYFEFGIFQGDPHPGNFLVSRETKLIFIDLGMIGFFDRKMRKDVLTIFLDVLNGDAKAATDDLIKMHMNKSKIDYNEFLESNQKLINEWHGQKVKEYSMSRLIYNFILNAINHGLKMPPSFILFGKSIVTIENVAVNLNPDFDLIKDVRPAMTEIFEEQLDLKELVKMKLKNYEKRMEAKMIEIARKAEEYIEKMVDKL
jgi:ubiquinone biosynthesis protein